jgi:NADPH:quinone reductase-like Zn-dependent oxidoreductase
MRSIVIKDSYGVENVTVQEQSLPSIKENEVLVKVQSISLNQLDLMIAKGAFGTQLPHTLGSDAAGIVEQVGTHIKKLKVGDAVATHFIQSWQSGKLTPVDLNSRLGAIQQGVFSEYIALPESSLVKIPTNLTTEEASTLPLAALTAWEAIVNVGKLEPGQTVLLQGTGGVSIFALQFAKAIGAKVIITSSSDEKLQKAKSLGADEVINYKEIHDWEKRVLELTANDGVDLALEMSWTGIGKTIDAVKFGGRIAVVGLLGGVETNLSAMGFFEKNLSIISVNVGSRSSFEAMIKLIETSKIQPAIEKAFNVSELSESLTFFEKGNHFGKVVLNF